MMPNIDGLSDLKLLASATNSVIYSGLDEVHDRRVAVKVMRVIDEAATRRFSRERRAMGRLSQIPNVADIYESGTTPEGDPYFVMPLYPGSLQDTLTKDGALAPTEAIDIAVKVGQAIAAAHSMDVLHLDVKPANVLLTTSREPQVADFGISELVQSTESLSGSMMTPDYSPPERFDGAKPDELVDVWSLGCLLFAMLVGKPPFSLEESTGPASTMNRILTEPAPMAAIPVSVPSDVIDVVSRALAKARDERVTSAAEFVDLLNAARGVTSEAGLHRTPAAPVIQQTGETILGVSTLSDKVLDPAVTREPTDRSSKKRAFVLVAVLLLAGLGFAASKALGGSKGGGRDDLVLVSEAAVGEVFLERAADSGVDPFFSDATLTSFDTDSVEPPAAQRSITAGGLAPVPTATLSNAQVLALAFKGSEPGLYGGTGNQASCDKDALIAFLEETPDKASAWAAAQGIAPDEIRTFVEGLTTVVLLADTRVTNHGFKNGVANPIQSVLQTGTAVMIDDSGVPRVKCNCGNPLREAVPQAKSVEIRGEVWDGFNPGAIATVTAADAPIKTLSLRDIDTGVIVERPISTDGEVDVVTTEPAPTPLSDLDDLATGDVSTVVAGASEVAAPASTAPAPTPDSSRTTASSEAPVDSTTTGLEAAAPTTTTRATTTTATPTTATPTTRAPRTTTTTRAPTTTTTQPPTTTTTTTTTTQAPKTNLEVSSRGSVSATSTFPGFSVADSNNGSESSSWFSAGAAGGASVYTWSAASMEITKIRFAGNGSHSNPEFRQGFGFSGVTVEVVSGGAVVWSGSGSGFGDTFNTGGVVGDMIRMRFSGREDSTCGGFSELYVFANV